MKLPSGITPRKLWTKVVGICVLLGGLVSAFGLFDRFWGQRPASHLQNAHSSSEDASKRTQPQPYAPLQNDSAAPAIPPPKQRKPTIPTPLRNEAKISTGPITQTTNAPCSGNSVTGNVDITNCNPPVDPYKSTEFYEIDGTKRSLSYNGVSMNQNAKVLFLRMLAEGSRKDWEALLSTAIAAKQQYPEWHTPDSFAGDALVGLCSIDRAKDSYKKFLAETAGQSAYNSVIIRIKELLERIDDPSFTGCSTTNPKQ